MSLYILYWEDPGVLDLYVLESPTEEERNNLKFLSGKFINCDPEINFSLIAWLYPDGEFRFKHLPIIDFDNIQRLDGEIVCLTVNLRNE